MQEKAVVRMVCPDVLDSKGWERPLASGCGSEPSVWRRWVVLRTWALLCPWFPGVIVAESLQGLIFVAVYLIW